MKTLTEFSTLTLRKAAAARSAAGGSRTQVPTVADASPAAPVPEELSEPPAAPDEAAPEASVDAADVAVAAEPGETSPDASASGEAAPPAGPADPAIEAIA